MQLGELLTMAVPSLVAGALAFGLRTVSQSRAEQGKRIGALESWRDQEIGRRAGYEAGVADGRREAARGGQ